MADYIYLLQTRLTPAQQTTLQTVRDAARAHGTTVFLVGGAVRDLTSGSPVRDLDLAVQGNPTRLKKDLQKAGAVLVGESGPTQALYFTFPGGVRVEVGATLSATWPKPGKPVYTPANILDDLRRRDFTANAMAISLNEGSFGLLMDPLNGVADLENRELRLVSNYGFIEDPVRMIRAARLSARLGWHLEEKTQQRYDAGKAENYVQAMGTFERGYELEEIFHEDDPLRVLRRLESEGWMDALYPGFSAAKANESELNKLRDLVGQLELVGIVPDPSAIQFPLLTAKLQPKDVAAIKKLLARPGFVEQIAALEPATKEFASQFTGKAAAAPSDAWKLLHAAAPEVVLSLGFSSKSGAVQARYSAFVNDWSQARTRIPYQLMQEMRITPDLPGYADLVETLHFAIMDNKLDTPEAAKAFLEPYSPPAPPPPMQLRRRAAKREPKVSKAKAAKKAAAAAAEGIALAAGEAADAPGTTPQASEAVPTPVAAKAAAPKAAVQPGAKAAQAKKAVAVKPPATKSVPAKAAAKPVAKKAAPAKKAVAKKVALKPAKKAAPAKKLAVKAAPAKKTPAKKTAAKKPPTKAAKTKAPAKKSAKTGKRR